MDLSLSEEQQHISESAATFLSAASPMSAVRATSQSGGGMDAELWRSISELGWCGVHLPETVDGLGLGQVELMLLQEQMGRHLACVPFFESVVLVATALRELPQSPLSQDWLAQLASGQAMGSLAWPGQAEQGDLPHCDQAGTACTLFGLWPQVGAAATADVLLLPAQGADGVLGLWLVPANAPGVQVQPVVTLDATRPAAHVLCQGVALPSTHRLAEGSVLTSALERVRQLGAVALAGEQVGVAQQCLDLTLAYVAQRQQFDRPIASFQAVKHRCAQMLVAVEGARSAVYGAAAAADAMPSPESLLFHAAQARVMATEAAQFCARESIQLHGGVGFTWEYDPHLFLRRAQASSQQLGAVPVWLEQVAAQLLDSPEVVA